jgi:hypothetical protein
MQIQNLLNRPKVIGIIGDINNGKSMLLYHILEQAKSGFNFNLYYYGLRLDIDGVNAQRIYSVQELERINNSVIIIDELSSLFDLDNRKCKRAIEQTLRLLNHNNNIIILCGVPENFKKFIAAKIDEIFYKTCTVADFINGTTCKNTLLAYSGNERGSELLNLPVDKALYYNGNHYSLVTVPYYAKYDSKADNAPILSPKTDNPILSPKENVQENVPKNVPKNVPVFNPFN